MPDALERYRTMVEKARETLAQHASTAPVNLPVSSPEWSQWIRDYKNLAGKLADAHIALVRAMAMNVQGVLDDRRFR
jgi:hypothetical protein